MLKRLVGAGLALLAVLAGIIVFRTLSLSHDTREREPIPIREVDAEAVAARLAGGLQLRTISYGADEAIPADEFFALHDHLERSYPRAHQVLSREMISEYSLLYTWKGTDESLSPGLLMAHQDVVPVDEGEWQEPPFSGRIVDGELWGRGAIDDKGALFAILEAVELLLSEGREPARTILLFFGHDEELGGPRGAAVVASLLESRGVELAWVIDEGGFVVEGMVPGVKTPVALVGIAEKGSVTLDLILDGSGGHSSVPPRHTAIGIVSEAISRLEANPMPGGIDDLNVSFFEALAPHLPVLVRAALANLWLTRPLVEAAMATSPPLDAMQRTTTAVTIIEGGVKSNVLPSHVRATVNFRIRPGDTADTVQQHVRETIDDERIEIVRVGMHREASPVSPTDSEAFALLSRTIAEVFSGLPAIPYLVVAGTDSRHFYRLTPNVFRFNPFRFGPTSMTMPHGKDERVDVESLGDAVRFYARLIDASGG